MSVNRAEPTANGSVEKCPKAGAQLAKGFLAGTAVGVFCVGVVLPLSIISYLIRKAERSLIRI